jgi:hypothetical protein
MMALDLLKEPQPVLNAALAPMKVTFATVVQEAGTKARQEPLFALAAQPEHTRKITLALTVRMATFNRLLDQLPASCALRLAKEQLAVASPSAQHAPQARMQPAVSVSLVQPEPTKVLQDKLYVPLVLMVRLRIAKPVKRRALNVDLARTRALMNASLVGKGFITRLVTFPNVANVQVAMLHCHQECLRVQPVHPDHTPMEMPANPAQSVTARQIVACCLARCAPPEPTALRLDSRRVPLASTESFRRAPVRHSVRLVLPEQSTVRQVAVLQSVSAVRQARLEQKERLNALTVLLENMRHRIPVTIVRKEISKVMQGSLRALHVHQGMFRRPRGRQPAHRARMEPSSALVDKLNVDLVARDHIMGLPVDHRASVHRVRQGATHQLQAPPSVRLALFQSLRLQLEQPIVLLVLLAFIEAHLPEVQLNALPVLQVPLALQESQNAEIVLKASTKRTMFVTYVLLGGARLLLPAQHAPHATPGPLLPVRGHQRVQHVGVAPTRHQQGRRNAKVVLLHINEVSQFQAQNVSLVRAEK